MKLVYLLGFLCLVAAGSDIERINDEDYYKRNEHNKTRIAGGTEAYIQDMPFMATFIKKGPSYKSGLGPLICTAVIIQPFWALMAAICLVKIDVVDHNFLKSGLYVIRSNTAFFDGSTYIYRDHVIVEWYAERLYDDSDHNITRRILPSGGNLGLVKVKTEFNGKYEKPINIVPRNYQYKVGSKAIQAGWGATEASPSARLMVADTTLTDYENCRRFYQYYFLEPDVQIVTPDMVCTFAHGKRPCTGDSGGPLIQDGRLIAILEYYNPCGVTDWPDIYTKIANYVGWIEDTIFN